MKQIAAALVKAQKEFEPARKQSNNPHFRSKYASLENCVDAVLSALNSNGIFLCQPCHDCADGVMVETVFIHESGEMFSAGKLHVPAAKQDPQGYGSALTYARRYSLLSACGIAPEDDDGNAATTAVNSQPKQQTDAAKLYKDLLHSIQNAKNLDDLNRAYAQVEDAAIPDAGKVKLADFFNIKTAQFTKEVF